MPLEQVATQVSGDVKRKDFHYHEVVYFRGYELEPGQQLKLDVGTTWVAKVGKPSVEVGGLKMDAAMSVIRPTVCQRLCTRKPRRSQAW